MKVKEVISMLAKLDRELDIVIYDDDGTEPGYYKKIDFVNTAVDCSEETGEGFFFGAEDTDYNLHTFFVVQHG